MEEVRYQGWGRHRNEPPAGPGLVERAVQRCRSRQPCPMAVSTGWGSVERKRENDGRDRGAAGSFIPGPSGEGAPSPMGRAKSEEVTHQQRFYSSNLLVVSGDI